MKSTKSRVRITARIKSIIEQAKPDCKIVFHTERNGHLYLYFDIKTLRYIQSSVAYESFLIRRMLDRAKVALVNDEIELLFS